MCGRGDLDAAQARYAAMAADGVQPDITSINTLVGGFVQAQRLDEVSVTRVPADSGVPRLCSSG